MREYRHMTVIVKPPGTAAGPALELDAIAPSLDALIGGGIDADGFLATVTQIIERHPDAIWDVLSLLDQRYRLGKITQEQFRSLRRRLEAGALNAPPGRPATAPESTNEPASMTAARPAESQERARVGQKPRRARQPVGPASGGQRDRAVPLARAPGQSARLPGVGEVVRGRYRILGVASRDESGIVFDATDSMRLDLPGLDERVALKVAAPAPAGAPAHAADLRREFYCLQSLSHPAIVRVFDFDRDGDLSFYTQESVSGLTIDALLAARGGIALERPQALSIVRDAGAAIAFAHGKGIVHGDLSPGDIVVTNAGDVRVGGFGGRQPSEPGPWISDFDASRAAPVVPSAYASCQRLAGEEPELRDDVYSLACIAYLLLAGEHPFGGRSAVEARSLRLRPRRPQGMTARQWGALRSGLEFDRAQRPLDVSRWLELIAPARGVRLPGVEALTVVAPRRPERGSPVLPLLLFLLVAAGLLIPADRALLEQAAGRIEESGRESVAALRALLASAGRGGKPDAVPPQGTTASSSAPAGATTPTAIASTPRVPVPGPVPAPVPEPTAVQAPAVGGTSPAAIALPPAVRAAAPARSTARAPAPKAAAPGTIPPAKLEFASATVEMAAQEPAARVLVRRKGSLRNEVTFSWWTEPGTARANEDFAAFAPHEGHIEAGKDSAVLLVPVVVNARRADARNFYVAIDNPGPGAVLGDKTVAIVTIPARE